MTEKLIEVQSIHEQREFDGSTRKRDVGSFVEINDLNVVIEEVKIIEQYKITDIKKEEKDNKEYYEIVCEKRDFEDERKIKEEFVRKIIEKHHDIIKSSFVKCLVDGIDSKSVNALKQMLFKLRGDVDEGI